MKDEVVILFNCQRQRIGLWQMYGMMLKNIWRSRWFIWVLFARDYFMANKRSILGYGWLFLAPLLSSVSWIVMNLLGVLNTGDLEVPFPIFVLIGTSFWSLFFNSYLNSVGVLDSAVGMLGTVNFPHESLIIVQSLKVLANFLIASVFNTVILFLFGVHPNIYWIFLPLMVVPVMFLAISIGLLLMIIKYTVPDLEKAFIFVFPIFLYITPIVFLPTEKSEKFFFIIKYNPLTYLIGVPRDIVLFGYSQWWSGYAPSVIISVVLFLLMLRVFYIAEEYLIEKIY